MFGWSVCVCEIHTQYLHLGLKYSFIHNAEEYGVLSYKVDYRVYRIHFLV